MTECFESTENLSEIYIYIFHWVSFPFDVEKQLSIYNKIL